MLVSQLINAKENTSFQPVKDLFEAISQVDHNKIRTAVTSEFLLLEHGEVWSIDDLIKVVKPSTFKRTNFFNVISIKQQQEMAWINYWNKANFSNGEKSQEVMWLESVVVIKKSGQWKLAQMHSTRIKPEKFPKNIKFEKSF